MPTNCPFLQLPGELRNTILRHHLLQPDPIHLLKLQWTKDGTGYHPLLKPEPALSQVCKTLKQEVLSLYYAENTFHLGAQLHLLSMHEIPDALARWTRRLGDNARFLTRVELAVNCEILEPRRGKPSGMYGDFWEIVTVAARVEEDGAVRVEVRGDPSFGVLCVCDLGDFLGARGREREVGVGEVLAEVSRLFFRTTELVECGLCRCPRLVGARGGDENEVAYVSDGTSFDDGSTSLAVAGVVEDHCVSDSRVGKSDEDSRSLVDVIATAYEKIWLYVMESRCLAYWRTRFV